MSHSHIFTLFLFHTQLDLPPLPWESLPRPISHKPNPPLPRTLLSLRLAVIFVYLLLGPSCHHTGDNNASCPVLAQLQAQGGCTKEVSRWWGQRWQGTEKYVRRLGGGGPTKLVIELELRRGRNLLLLNASVFSISWHVWGPADISDFLANILKLKIFKWHLQNMIVFKQHQQKNNKHKEEYWTLGAKHCPEITMVDMWTKVSVSLWLPELVHSVSYDPPAQRAPASENLSGTGPRRVGPRDPLFKALVWSKTELAPLPIWGHL